MFLSCLVEASNVINVPKCNKGSKCNNFWPWMTYIIKFMTETQNGLMG